MQTLRSEDLRASPTIEQGNFYIDWTTPVAIPGNYSA